MIINLIESSIQTYYLLENCYAIVIVIVIVIYQHNSNSIPPRALVVHAVASVSVSDRASINALAGHSVTNK